MKFPVSFRVWPFSNIGVWQELLFALFETRINFIWTAPLFLPSHLFQVNRSALFAMQQIHIKSFCFGYMFISSELGWMTWHGWMIGFGSVVGSLQELWQRPVLPQLAPAEIEYHWSFENTQWRKVKQLRVYLWSLTMTRFVFIEIYWGQTCHVDQLNPCEPLYRGSIDGISKWGKTWPDCRMGPDRKWPNIWLRP